MLQKKHKIDVSNLCDSKRRAKLKIRVMPNETQISEANLLNNKNYKI
ncbi:hypothetical protein FLAVO9AF_140020 [Flavobacterium sp. 9AF]|nr:hypothetical protein FLAVO9AF_140020 [Flavobacterium sp. 9AF]